MGFEVQCGGFLRGAMRQAGGTMDVNSTGAVGWAGPRGAEWIPPRRPRISFIRRAEATQTQTQKVRKEARHAGATDTQAPRRRREQKAPVGRRGREAAWLAQCVHCRCAHLCPASPCLALLPPRLRGLFTERRRGFDKGAVGREARLASPGWPALAPPTHACDGCVGSHAQTHSNTRVGSYNVHRLPGRRCCCCCCLPLPLGPAVAPVVGQIPIDTTSFPPPFHPQLSHGRH